jgi:hypothetical protein
MSHWYCSLPLLWVLAGCSSLNLGLSVPVGPHTGVGISVGSGGRIGVGVSVGVGSVGVSTSGQLPVKKEAETDAVVQP